FCLMAVIKSKASRTVLTPIAWEAITRKLRDRSVRPRSFVSSWPRVVAGRRESAPDRDVFWPRDSRPLTRICSLCLCAISVSLWLELARHYHHRDQRNEMRRLLRGPDVR